MIVIDDTGREQEITVTNTWISRYGKNLKAKSMLSSEASSELIQTDKDGRYFIQKGGCQRIYLDNTVISDYGISVPDFLNNQNKFEVTITLKAIVKSYDTNSAKQKAMAQLESNIYRTTGNNMNISNISANQVP